MNTDTNSFKRVNGQYYRPEQTDLGIFLRKCERPSDVWYDLTARRWRDPSNGNRFCRRPALAIDPGDVMAAERARGRGGRLFLVAVTLGSFLGLAGCLATV